MSDREIANLARDHDVEGIIEIIIDRRDYSRKTLKTLFNWAATNGYERLLKLLLFPEESFGVTHIEPINHEEALEWARMYNIEIVEDIISREYRGAEEIPPQYQGVEDIPPGVMRGVFGYLGEEEMRRLEDVPVMREQYRQAIKTPKARFEPSEQIPGDIETIKDMMESGESSGEILDRLRTFHYSNRELNIMIQLSIWKHYENVYEYIMGESMEGERLGEPREDIRITCIPIQAAIDTQNPDLAWRLLEIAGNQGGRLPVTNGMAIMASYMGYHELALYIAENIPVPTSEEEYKKWDKMITTLMGGVSEFSEVYRNLERMRGRERERRGYRRDGRELVVEEEEEGVGRYP